MKNNSPYLAGARRSAAGMTTRRSRGQQVMQAHQTQHLKRKTEAQIWEQEKFRLLLKLSVGLTPGVIPYLPRRKKGQYWHNVLYKLLAPGAIVTNPPEPPAFGYNTIQIWKSQTPAPEILAARCIRHNIPGERYPEIRWNRRALIPKRPYAPRVKIFQQSSGIVYNLDIEEPGNYSFFYTIKIDNCKNDEPLLYICWYELEDGSPSNISSGYITWYGIP